MTTHEQNLEMLRNGRRLSVEYQIQHRDEDGYWNTLDVVVTPEAAKECLESAKLDYDVVRCILVESRQITISFE